MIKRSNLSNELDQHLQLTLQEFKTLVQIVAQLRGPNGCPWDKQQTQKTLAPYAIEEAFELAEAIERQDQPEVQEELGDYLFQVLLQAQVAQDEGHFSLLHVIKGLSEKMVRRHPHVFGDSKAESLNEISKNWDQIKAEEKKDRPAQQKPVFSYPTQLPALQAAHKIGQRTHKLKFDWQKPEEVFEKVLEEVREVEAELNQEQRSSERLEQEIGDVLFSVAQLARHLQLEPEQCLRSANRRFEKRFNEVLKQSKVPIDQFAALPLETKEQLWQDAKKSTDGASEK